MVSKELILKSFNEVIDKCNVLKGSKYYASANNISERFGLTLSKCSDKELVFKDTKNDTVLDFSGFLDRNDLINFDGEEMDSMFSLEDIIGFYNNASDVLKKGTNLIHFENYVFDEENYNPSDMEQFHIKHKGLYNTASKFWDNDNNVQKSIRITPKIFDKSLDVEGEWNVERCILHEMFHCLDYKSLNKRQRDLMRRGNGGKPPLTKDEHKEFYELYSNKRNQMSYSVDEGFEEAVNKDMDFQRSKGLTPSLVSNYAISFYDNSLTDVKLSENFADIGSVVAFKDRDDKSNAKLRLGDETLYFDEIRERFPNTFEYMSSLI